MTLIENAVTLADVAKVTRRPIVEIEADCRQLDLFVGADWAGRAAVEVRDAEAIVTGAARRDHDHTVAWRAFQDATEAWEAERMAVYNAANQAAHEEATRAGIGAPAGFAAAKDATQDAVEAWESKHPAPTFGGNATGRTWFAKIKEVVR